MELENLSIEKFDFNELFRTYVLHYSELSPLFNGDPFSEEAIEDKASLVDSGDRSAAIEAVVEYNSGFDLPEASRRNLERLQRDDAVALVTGQQVNILGGPLYTVFKTITTIHLASVWEKTLNRPVIPVFWMADEDHDYGEINSVHIPKGQEVAGVNYDQPVESQPASSRIKIEKDFEAFRQQIRNVMRETDFSGELWDMLDDCYQKGVTLGHAFGQLMYELFGSHGLVLAGSDHPEIKRRVKDSLIRSVESVESIRDALETQTEKIRDQFHQQVKLYDSNLFYHSDHHGRLKISRDGDTWNTGKEYSWSREELKNAIDQHPERFSPNVFLRPILQDKLLPTVMYIGGPGEISYYAQMKKLYNEFGLEMPVIKPRMSGTILESSIRRILEKLPFDIPEYQNRIEDLETEYARQAEELDTETLFEDWKREIQQLSDHYSEQIREVDPTLVKAVGKATAVYYNELDKLKGKVHRSTKEQEETQLSRIRKIKSQLFPNNGLQERSISFIYFMNKYGMDIWDRFLESLKEDEQFKQHKLIEL